MTAVPPQQPPPHAARRRMLPTYSTPALAYPIAALLAEGRYGLTGLIVALAACLVVQLAIIETRRTASSSTAGRFLAS